MKLFMKILESGPESLITAKSQNRSGSISYSIYSVYSEYKKGLSQ